jgi:hypothetical protein
MEPATMSNPPRRLRSLALISVAGIFGGALVGCETDPFSRDAMLRGNLTPELLTLHERHVDSDNAVAITFNENLRMFSEDLGRAAYWDRPSRLTREPVPR